MSDVIFECGDVLQTLGVSAKDATRYAMIVIHQAREASPKPSTTFVEVCGEGNMMRIAGDRMRNLNITGLSALDLRTQKPNGDPWDVSKRSDRRQAYRLIRDLRPDWVIGSPPCTPFSQPQSLNPDTPESRRKWKEGVEHMKFVIKLYRKQIDGGRAFLHEHPAHAKSWGLKEVQEMAKTSGVDVKIADQCMYVWSQDVGKGQVSVGACQETHQVYDKLQGHCPGTR